MSAAVEAIDHDTRVVTLRKSDGEAITLTAGEEVRNLDQVEVGDSLIAEYTLSLSVEVLENDGIDPEAAQASALVRAEQGQKPGMAAMDAAVVVATVEDINVEANTFKLKLPDGSVNEYVARNPENLKRAAVGDLVVITTTESVAIAVQEQPKKQ